MLHVPFGNEENCLDQFLWPWSGLHKFKERASLFHVLDLPASSNCGVSEGDYEVRKNVISIPSGLDSFRSAVQEVGSLEKD
jgi:hypothetical protein